MLFEKILTFVTGRVNQELLLKNEYLAEQLAITIKIIESLNKRLRLTDSERIRLAKLAKRLKPQALEEATLIVRPETVRKWYHRLIARHHDYSHLRKQQGRPRTSKHIENLILQMANDNCAWGYKQIAASIKNLDESISPATVKNILIRNGIPPSGKRKNTDSWHNFIKQHKTVWAADFFTVDIKPRLFTKLFVTYYVIFFIHIHSRRTVLGGITPYPDEEWMKQTARNLTGFDGELINASHLIHDQDTKYTSSFDELFRSSGIEPLKLPVQSLNLNTYAERFIRSIREECLRRCILVGEKSLRKVISEYFEYYHHERNHQGKNRILFPYPSHSNSSDKVILTTSKGTIRKKSRLGGLLNYYYCQAPA